MYDIVLGAGFQTVDQPATFWVAKMLLGPVAPRLLNFMSQLRKKEKKKVMTIDLLPSYFIKPEH